MAVAYDAVSQVVGSDNDFTHTPVGTPTLAVVTCHRRAGDTTSYISGITYGGAAMTRHAFIDSSGNSGPMPTGNDSTIVEIWYKEGPTAGAQTVAVTQAGTNDTREVYVCTTYTGSINTTTPLGTIDTDYGNSNDATSVSASITSESDGLCVDALCTEEVETHTVDSGQTERYQGSDSTSNRACVSTEPGAATVSMGWSWTTATRRAYIAVPINPAGGAAQAPKAPTACTATADGDSITAGFTDNTSGVAQHRAYIRRTSDSTWTWAGDLAAGETSYTHYWLASNTNYTVAFTSFDSDAESAMTSATADTGTVRTVSGSFL